MFSVARPGDEQKENAQIKMADDVAPISCATPQRAPLRDVTSVCVNAPSDTAAVKRTTSLTTSIKYSPITPVFLSPLSHGGEVRDRRSCLTVAPKRLGANEGDWGVGKGAGGAGKGAGGGRRRSQVVMSDEVMLNALVYDKAKRCAEHQLKQGYEDRLREQGDQLRLLRSELESARAETAGLLANQRGREGSAANLLLANQEKEAKSVLTQTQTSFIAEPMDEKATMTSPFCRFLSSGLLQQQGGATASDAGPPTPPSASDLADQLEVALMSGDILRAELHALERARASLERDVGLWRGRAEGGEARVGAAVRAAQAESDQALAAQRAQQAVLEQQLSAVQASLDVERREAGGTNARQEREICALRDTVARLQTDLALVYRQSKHATDESIKYRELFERTLVSERTLQTQLDEYACVGPAMDEAKAAQLAVAGAVRDAFTRARALLERTRAERAAWTTEKSEWVVWKQTEERLVADLRLTYESAVEEHRACGGLGERVRAGESRVEKLTIDLEQVCAELAGEQKHSADLGNRLCAAERSLAELTQLSDELKQQLETEEEGRRVEVLNLQRTLDVRESEIDAQQAVHARITHQATVQRAELERLRRDARCTAQLGAQLRTMEAQMKSLSKASADARAALEAEKAGLVDELEGARRQVEEDAEDKLSLVTRLELLQSQVSCLESELTETRGGAEALLGAQNRELGDAALALGTLMGAVEALRSDVLSGVASLQPTGSADLTSGPFIPRSLDPDPPGSKSTCSLTDGSSAGCTDAASHTDTGTRKPCGVADSDTKPCRAADSATKVCGLPGNVAGLMQNGQGGGQGRGYSGGGVRGSFLCSVLQAATRSAAVGPSAQSVGGPVPDSVGPSAQSSTPVQGTVGPLEQQPPPNPAVDSEASDSLEIDSSESLVLMGGACPSSNDSLASRSSSPSEGSGGAGAPGGARCEESLAQRVHAVCAVVHEVRCTMCAAVSTVLAFVRDMEAGVDVERRRHATSLARARSELCIAQRAEAAQARRLELSEQAREGVEQELGRARARLLQLTDQGMALVTHASNIERLHGEIKQLTNQLKVSDAQIAELKSTIADRLSRLDAADGGATAAAGTGAVLKQLTEDNVRLVAGREKLLQLMHDKVSRLEGTNYRLEQNYRGAIDNVGRAEKALAAIDVKLERTRLALLPHACALGCADPIMHHILTELGAFPSPSTSSP